MAEIPISLSGTPAHALIAGRRTALVLARSPRREIDGVAPVATASERVVA